MSKVYKSTLPGFPQVTNKPCYPDGTSGSTREYASGGIKKNSVISYPVDHTSGKGKYASGYGSGKNLSSYPKDKPNKEGKESTYASYKPGKDAQGNKQVTGKGFKVVTSESKR